MFKRIFLVPLIIFFSGSSSSSRAALWSRVHVLQWFNGDDITFWCYDWIEKEVRFGFYFLYVTPPCPCTLDQAQIDIGRFSPHPLCNIDISSPSNCIHKPGAMHCVRANTPRYFVLNIKGKSKLASILFLKVKIKSVKN